MTSTDLIDCRTLAQGSLIDVETKSRHYRIECLAGNSIRISGHPDYCPNPVAAQLQGSVDENGRLGSGVIGRGMRLVVLLKNENRPITTSKVLNVSVDEADLDQ